MAVRQAAEEAKLREELVTMEDAVKQAKARERVEPCARLKLAVLSVC